mgnify:CR=1 FL=1
MQPTLIEHPIGKQTSQLYYGQDASVTLDSLPEKSVHMVCTSPPYWGLRDYDQEDQLGQETDVEDYLQRLVSMCAKVHRVLRDDGTLWVNLGDSYGGSGFASSVSDGRDTSKDKKQLIGVPWRFALAMKAAGWILRQDIIWHKPNGMPEQVRDRFTRSNEYIFLFSKKEHYFFDVDAVREPAVTYDGYRRRKNVWSIPTQPYQGAHFAAWPEEMVSIMVRSGTSQRGCCASCQTPYKPNLVLTDLQEEDVLAKRGVGGYPARYDGGTRAKTFGGGLTTRYQTEGYVQDCKCPTQEVLPCVVMDIFSGSGTTGKVSMDHGRSYIGLDLNADYLPLALNRIQHVQSSVTPTPQPDFDWAEELDFG